jgi:osmotically-inducible protein OsmY
MKPMSRTTVVLVLSLTVIMGLFLTGCPRPVDEKIKESTHIGALDEATHARDLAIASAVETNIKSDPVLQWYAQLPGSGFNVEVSHAVATVHMKVKTDALKQQVLDLAKQATDVRDIVDEVEVDPNMEDPPFEW